MNEIVFEVTREADGGFCAECRTESIFTQGDTWEELPAKLRKAVAAFYFDRPRPARSGCASSAMKCSLSDEAPA